MQEKSEKARLFQTGSFVPWLSYDNHFGKAETDTKLPAYQKGRNTMKKSWLIRSAYPGEDPNIRALGEALNLSPLTAGLLWNREIRDRETALRFLQFSDHIFHDPFLLSDMDKAADRIERALADGEKIVIYGDYDVDGITATSLLYLYLTSRGAKELSYYIPGRTDEGYGVNADALRKLAAEGTRLIVTVDTGVTAIEEAALAAELSVDLVITDHHECREILPDAAAVVNPMRPDEKYPFRALAGVGVAFKLVCAMEKRRLGEGTDYLTPVCREYADLVAIGTIADVMPLLDENRLLVSMGLEMLSKNPRPAIAMLLEEASRGGRGEPGGAVTSTTISYTIAPRINAAGRMARADKAVELFLSPDPQRIRAAAAELCEINRLRQEEENRIVSEAVELIRAQDLTADPNLRVLVLAKDGWNAGVIGIVASRITERYGLPSILITFDGDQGKGSGRSIKGLNLVEALAECSNLLTKFGGHELAAGLSIERSALSEFRRRINEYACGKITDPSQLAPQLTVEFPVQPTDLTLAGADQLRLLEPYGAANPSPLFLLTEAKVTEITELAGKHTKMTVRKDGIAFVALCFGSKRENLDVVCGDLVDLVFQLSVNSFRGVDSVQLIVRDFRPSGLQISDRDVKQAAQILSGGSYRESDGFLPNRDDFAAVYLFLKHRIGQNRDRFISSREILSALAPRIGYVKLHIILEVLSETGLIGLSGGSIRSDIAAYTIGAVRQKIDLEKSPLYGKIKAKMVE